MSEKHLESSVAKHLVQEKSGLEREWELLCSIPQNLTNGIADRMQELKDNPLSAAPMMLGAFAIGAMGAYFSKKPAALCKMLTPLVKNPESVATNIMKWTPKVGMAWMGLDIGSRFAQPMFDTAINPNNLEHDKVLLGKNLGSAVVDYPLMGIGGLSGHLSTDLGMKAMPALLAMSEGLKGPQLALEGIPTNISGNKGTHIEAKDLMMAMAEDTAGNRSNGTRSSETIKTVETARPINEIIDTAKTDLRNAAEEHPELSKAVGWLADARYGRTNTAQNEMLREALNVVRPYKGTSKEVDSAFNSIERHLKAQGATTEDLLAAEAKLTAQRVKEAEIQQKRDLERQTETNKAIAECAKRAREARMRAAKADGRQEEALKWSKREPGTVEFADGPIASETIELPTYQSGGETKINYDGMKKITVLRDGTEITDHLNGFRETLKPDKTQVCEWPDGTRHTSTHTQKGTIEVRENEDGGLFTMTENCRCTEVTAEGQVSNYIDWESLDPSEANYMRTQYTKAQREAMYD